MKPKGKGKPKPSQQIETYRSIRKPSLPRSRVETDPKRAALRKRIKGFKSVDPLQSDY